MSDLLPPMTEVKISDHYHVSLALRYVGADSIVEELEALREDFKKLPGLALAIATAKASTTESLARITAKNITLAVKHGFDPETQTLTMGVAQGWHLSRRHERGRKTVMAFKCDRCGELQVHRKGDVSVEYRETVSVDKTDGSPTQQGYELDLCRDCSRAFRAFIDERPRRTPR
jgi:hypothetical protein